MTNVLMSVYHVAASFLIGVVLMIGYMYFIAKALFAIVDYLENNAS